MMNEVRINLKGLTVDAKLKITEALIQSQKIVNDSDNAVALAVIKQFDEDKFDKNSKFTSEFEKM